MLTNEHFDRTRRLALSLAGIELVHRHRELLDRRSRRLGILDSAALGALLDGAEEGEPIATRQLLNLLTTKFTGFFRHPLHFEMAATHALRVACRHGRARLWSAAAATGEEPYSLAMTMIEAFGEEHPPVSILATDLDVETLNAAQRGEYNDSTLRAISQERRERFFNELSVPGRWKIAPFVQRLVNFRPLNLAAEDWPVDGPYDVIFCRNVLMYLESGCRQAALERMAVLLAPEGLLLLDPTENLGAAAPLFVCQGDGACALRTPASPRGSLTI